MSPDSRINTGDELPSGNIKNDSRGESGSDGSNGDGSKFTSTGVQEDSRSPRLSNDVESEDNAIMLLDEEEENHVTKYGHVQFRYIKRPKQSIWFTKPHALNYFKDGVLFRTKEERTSSKLELFLDLMYVGIVANLAGEASENASGIALLKYLLFFIPSWVVWADIKDAVNYYYNEDLSQKTYLFWILCLLTLYVNSHGDLTKSVQGAALTIVPYMLCRLSLAIMLVFYSFFVPQHRAQIRLYSTSILITSSLWIIVIFIGNRAKVGVSIAIMFLEQVCFSFAFHPFLKKLLKLRMSTALNIEHEVERMATFVTIAIGEFLYKAVATNPLGPGLTAKYARGVFMILIAYNLFWVYNYGSTCSKVTHALRHSAATAIGWIYAHLPLIAALVLAADAGGELTASDNTSTKRHQNESSLFEGESHIESIKGGIFSSYYFRRQEGGEHEEELNMYALSFFFTGGISFSLVCMFVIGMLDKDMDPKGLLLVPRYLRIGLRIPAAIIIVLVSLAELNTTLLMGIVTAITTVVFFYESIVQTPINDIGIWCRLFPDSGKKAQEIQDQREIEERNEIQENMRQEAILLNEENDFSGEEVVNEEQPRTDTIIILN
jgi:low temperature requirement protein LtrA